MLRWQDRQHRLSSIVYWALLGTSESGPTICAKRNGRLSGTIATMRYGLLISSISIDSIPILTFWNFILHLQQCNDDVKLEMPSDPSESDISKYTNKFERCAIQCVDKNIEILPKLFKTIKSVLSKGPQNIPNWFESIYLFFLEIEGFLDLIAFLNYCIY